MEPIWAAPAWAKSVAAGVLMVGVLAWTISKTLEKQQKQLDRIETMLRRLPGTTPSAHDHY